MANDHSSCQVVKVKAATQAMHSVEQAAPVARHRRLLQGARDIQGDNDDRQAWTQPLHAVAVGGNTGLVAYAGGRHVDAAALMAGVAEWARAH
jgi:hypothetical protein